MVLPTSSFPSESQAPVAPNSSTPLSPTFKECLEQGNGLRWPVKIGQHTLAARRAAKGRPPIVRRRSRSLDDETRTQLPEREAEPFRIDPTPYLDSRASRHQPTSTTPFSASSFSSDCTTIPSSGISSSCATTAPSPYIACPMTPGFSLGQSDTGAFTIPPPITRSFSDTALDLPFAQPLYTLNPVDLPQSQSSKSLSKSYSAADHRLASWIKVTSSPYASTPPLPPLAESPAPSLHQTQPVRHTFTPVLPSPLSESYTSDGDSGFPFPATPVLPSFASLTTSAVASTSRSSTSEQASDEGSVQSAPVVSPMIARKHTRAHTFASATTPVPRSSPYRSTSLPSPTAGVPPPAPPASTSQDRRSIPLTPPDSLCTAPFLANASASEQAWHEILGSRIESNALPAVAQAQMSLMKGDGKGKGKDAPRFSTPTPEEEEGGKKSSGNELMNTVGGGHFATTTREKLAQLIREHVGGVPLEKEDSVVQIVEYGAIHSKSSGLVQPILAHFAARHQELVASKGLSPDPALDEIDELSFSILHTDKPASDFRSLAQTLESSTSPSESYLHADPTLDGRVFSTFAARPFGSKVVPKGSVSVGFSAMSLHWPSTDRK